MIPDAIVARTREASDIVQIISEYVRLKKRGQNYTGLCPFHTEKTPSFNVNPARQIYHCFGCGRGGDVFGFLMEHERMGFVEAVTALAEAAHIEIPRAQRHSDDPSDRIYRANAVALEYFRKALAHEIGTRARHYLAERKISDALAEQFQIGYAPSRRRGLIKYAERQGVSLGDLERTGLVYTGDAESRDRFYERLTFPIRSLSGRTIAFGARDLSGQARAKYMNSPETAVYQKSRVLYGLYEARRAIQERRDVLICEGYMDLVRLWDHNFHNVVAASGTAFTGDQARLLARHADCAWLLFDADGPGVAAAMRSVAALFDAGLDVRVVSLPTGEDPDSFLLKFGAAKLQDQIERAQSYIEFCEQRAGGSFSALEPGQQDRLITEIAQTVRALTDPVRRDLLTRAAWSRFGVSEALFRERLAASTRTTRASPEKVNYTAPAAEGWRLEFLQFLLLNPEARAEAIDMISPEEYGEPSARALLALLFDPGHLDLDADTLLRTVNDPELKRLISELVNQEDPFKGTELSDYLRKMRRTRLEALARELMAQIRAAEREADSAVLEELSRRYHATREEWLRLEKETRVQGH